MCINLRKKKDFVEENTFHKLSNVLYMSLTSTEKRDHLSNVSHLVVGVDLQELPFYFHIANYRICSMVIAL